MSFLIPDSVQPWVYSWAWRSANGSHGAAARTAVARDHHGRRQCGGRTRPWSRCWPSAAPAGAPPFHHPLHGRTGTEQPVDWVAVDLDLIERYGVAFRSDWRQLRNSRRWLEQHRGCLCRAGP